ncbi:hypothetical protein EGY16_36755 [Burkholderia pseudomallei]|nr:hypothetical protein EGY16_36755 [Burkholderia pseudomallei]MBG1248315.1 hypothetical protein [Burkholderia pseudomallei]MBK3336981.1 hypothetical protein [Burkholderia pseudomallei]MPT66956.1 hypothetical protein [Burkholderia pseudomallei]MPT71949.1 hypothetical protein [Burkholderia pseudomallei]
MPVRHFRSPSRPDRCFETAVSAPTSRASNVVQRVVAIRGTGPRRAGFFRWRTLQSSPGRRVRACMQRRSAAARRVAARAVTAGQNRIARPYRRRRAARGMPPGARQGSPHAGPRLVRSIRSFRVAPFRKRRLAPFNACGREAAGSAAAAKCVRR